jgi:peptide/nickel transport system ATP-binding protein
MALLEVKDLCVQFRTKVGVNRAVEGLSFDVQAGETLAIVGESGCGKSVTSMSMLRLLPPKITRTSGSIKFNGQDILALSPKALRALRGNDIAMVFQEPMTSLNPVLTVGYQIAEALRLHQRLSKEEARQRAVEMLTLAGIPAPQQRAGEFPHQLSGGMRQRVMIAMALACQPKLLIADEPTTALDVTIQAQILDLMRGLQRRTGTAIVLVTHDLGVVADVADRVMVMYAGRKVESAPVGQIMNRPAHPYTQGLLASIPQRSGRGKKLVEIPGVVPSLSQPIVGCAFAERCPKAQSLCRELAPTLRNVSAEHQIACHFD